MIKVLQIGNKAPWPPDDGSSIAIYNMAMGLIHGGVDLHLLTINTKKHFKPDHAIPESFRKAVHYRSVYKNTNPTPIGAFLNLFSSRSYFVTRFRFNSFKKALVELLKTEKFDFVQLEGVFMANYIPEIKKYSTAKIVLRAHNVEHQIWERHIQRESRLHRKWYLQLQNKRLRNFELNAMRQVDAIVPISKVDEDAFKALGFKGRLLTCMTGVDINGYRQISVPRKARSVFYIGSMDWIPNQEAVTWFIKNCWPMVRKEVPDARFFAGGKGMPLHFFHITEPGVSIIEHVTSAPAFFMEHDVMVVPLLSGSGIRIKIIEGMSYGKAIVSTRVGAEGIGYTPEKNILIADEPDDFAAAVIKLLKDVGERERIEQEALHYAKNHFDNKSVVLPLVEFYTRWIDD
jgi:glycosyltransferase involved in cell wall biosynthesis